MTEKRTVKVMIMAGGTGGHVYPALALARVLEERGHTVEWLGTARGIEARLVPAAGYPLHTLKIGGVRGHGLKTKLFAPGRILLAVIQAAKVIHKSRPQVVVGLGGFAAGPGGLAARLLAKPLVIHEQNAVAGTTNKLLARIADRRLLAFPDALPAGEWIGNPVRREIETLPAPAERFAGHGDARRLLVLGGSLGAMAINTLLPAALANIPVEARPLVRHQAGEKHVERTRAAYRERGVEAEVVPFIEDMAEALSWADLALCRAGALTVAEMAAAGLGAVLVPFPHAIDDHQTANAGFLEKNGAAVVRQQRDLTEANLAQLLSDLLANREKLKGMAEAARSLAVNNSASRFADICLELAHG